MSYACTSEHIAASSTRPSLLKAIDRAACEACQVECKRSNGQGVHVPVHRMTEEAQIEEQSWSSQTNGELI
jgi:Fe-S-cluster-containing dehydrogenase component